MSELEQAIGESVRRFRGATTQKELASEMKSRGHPNWSQTTVWQVETDKRSLKLAEAWALATIFDVPVDSLLGDEGRQRVRDAEAELLIAEVRLANAAADLDRAQKELRAAVAAQGASIYDAGLSPRAEALADFSVEYIASQALENDGGAAGMPRTATEIVDLLEHGRRAPAEVPGP